MPDETPGIRLCGASFPAPALTGPVRVRTPSPRRVSAFCVVVACLCCEFALCLCVVSSLSALRVCAVCVRCVSVLCVSRVGVVCLDVRKGHWVVPCSLVGMLVFLLGASLQDFALHREPDLHDRNARCRCTKFATVNELSVGAVALQTVTAVIPPRSLAEGKASRKVPLLPERSNRGPPTQHSSCHEAKAEGHNRFHSATTLVPKPCTSCRCSKASQRQEIQLHRRHLSGLWHPS